MRSRKKECKQLDAKTWIYQKWKFSAKLAQVLSINACPGGRFKLFLTFFAFFSKMRIFGIGTSFMTLTHFQLSIYTQKKSWKKGNFEINLGHWIIPLTITKNQNIASLVTLSRCISLKNPSNSKPKICL